MRPPLSILFSLLALVLLSSGLASATDTERCSRQTGLDAHHPAGIGDETSLIQASLHVRLRHAESSHVLVPSAPTSKSTAVTHAAAAPAATTVASADVPANIAKVKAPAAAAPAATSMASSNSTAAAPAKTVAKAKATSLSAGSVDAVRDLGDELADGDPAAPAANDGAKVDDFSALSADRAKIANGKAITEELKVQSVEGSVPRSTHANSVAELAEIEASEDERRAKLRDFTIAFLQVLLALIIVPVAIAAALAVLVRDGVTREKDASDIMIDQTLYEHLQPQALPVEVQIR